jgi:hypothetical protein
MKQCSRCGEQKALDSFYRTKRAKDGRQASCKECMRACYTGSRNKKKDHYNEVRRTRKRAKVEQWRAWKEEKGCSFCDENYGPCLQLHHLVSEEKEAAISEMVANDVRWERIMDEAAKGIIVCGNCHIKIHYGIIGV